MALPKKRKRKQREKSSLPWGIIVAAAVTIIGTLGILIYLSISSDRLANRANLEADRWLVGFWEKPIGLQGTAPETHFPLTRGLSPQDCAACHLDKYQEWSQSLHAQAMGPGVVGQFSDFGAEGQSQCLACHAPMSEQWAFLRDGAGTWQQNTLYDAALRDQGLVCAACHLREHVRHGPPLALDRSAPPGASSLLHGKPVRTAFFQSSEFCKTCHQHNPSTTLLINGKPVENTYQEWLESPYAEQGITCQQCHMPKRAHLWKGIHDPEMTASGVTITTAVEPERPRTGKRVKATLTLKNTGTGHAFPSYTTPAVTLKAAFLDDADRVIAGGFYEEKLLQRRLNMNTSPWTETFDTRVLPGQEAVLEFERTVPPEAKTLYLWVWVEPDQFYTGFFQSRLDNGDEFEGREQLQLALQNSLDNQYNLFQRRIPLDSDQ